MRHFKIQPASLTDHITDDGTELTKRPYPIVCDDWGNVEGMATVKRVVGFVRDLARHQVDFSWHEVAARHVAEDEIVGMYVVIQAPDGHWATLVPAVETFETL